MIADFEDFCLWMYVVIDDVWQQVSGLFQHPGPQGRCSDSELMTMALAGECRGWDQETDLIQHWQEHRDLFPHVPERSRFNRRRRNLMGAINLIRRVVLQLMDLATDRQCTIDSLPVPVVQFHLVPQASHHWMAAGATFGKVPSKKQTIFGYKLHLLVTLGGVILDFELAPAHVSDLEIGSELLREHANLEVIGDKGYVSAPLADELWQANGIRLRTLPRRNQKQQLPQSIQHLLNACRQMIETVNSQLTEQFHIEVNHAYSFWGLCARLYTKLAAHTLCIYLNRLLGSANPLQIKALAFPS